MYPKKFGDINSLNVHAINTDHMIVFTLFVTKNHKICFANIQRKLIDLKPTTGCSLSSSVDTVSHTCQCDRLSPE